LDRITSYLFFCREGNSLLVSGDPLTRKEDCISVPLESRLTKENKPESIIQTSSYEPPIIGTTTQDHCCRRVLSLSLLKTVEFEKVKYNAKTLLGSAKKNKISNEKRKLQKVNSVGKSNQMKRIKPKLIHLQSSVDKRSVLQNKIKPISIKTKEQKKTKSTAKSKESRQHFLRGRKDQSIPTYIIIDD
jgi:hypothetical protein